MPGSTFALVGGNTSCVAIAAPGEPPALVLDAGTGIRNVSPLVDGPFAGTIILSHLHWDHVAGLPFFTAGDQPGAKVELLVPEQGRPAEALLAGLMGPRTSRSGLTACAANGDLAPTTRAPSPPARSPCSPARSRTRVVGPWGCG